MIVANSDFIHISKSLFWPDVIMLEAVDLDLMQSVSMTIGVQRQTEMNPIRIVFAGINDHLHSRGFLSRLSGPTTADESMSEVVDTLKEGASPQDNTESQVCTVSGICTSPGWTEVLYTRWWMCSPKINMM